MTRAAHNRRGFTLIELSIATLLMAILLGVLAEALIGGSAAFQQGTGSAEIDARGQRLLDRIADELRTAQMASITPNPLAPLGSSTLTFTRATGYAGGKVVSGPQETIRAVVDTGELDNGKDDNHNGLVDERRVELVPDLTKPTRVIMLGNFVRRYAAGETPNGKDDNGNGLVDEGGLSFVSDGVSTITIRLSIEVPGRGGRTTTRTFQTAVRIRNT